MNWLYADWINLAGAARLERLGLHIQEVSAAIGPDVSRDNASRSSNSLIMYRDSLMKKYDEYEQRSRDGGRRFLRGRLG